MGNTQLYYVTNRRHAGRSRWKPSGYGSEPSKDGSENLRFGRVALSFEKSAVEEHATNNCGFGAGNGKELADYLLSLLKNRSPTNAVITAFHENLKPKENESNQSRRKRGSTQAFVELQEMMTDDYDVLIYIHGFNVDWWESVASALSLQFMLNRHRDYDEASIKFKPVQVVLFSWPSDGLVIPYWSYFSDRSDAEISGYALGRGFLKLRDYLIDARRLERLEDEDPCRQSIHLLCHSMGNYVLQNALARTTGFSVGGKPPRIFDQIFLCSADVADDVLNPREPLCRLPQMTRNVTIYHNKGDLTMPVSDYTKGNTDRLGWNGADKPSDLDSRIHQVDCSGIVTGLIEHSYYHCGHVVDDICQSIDGMSPDHGRRRRQAVRNGWPNVWYFANQ